MSSAVGVAILVFAGVDTALTVKLINRVSEPGYGVEKRAKPLTKPQIEARKVQAAMMPTRETMFAASDFFRLQ